MTFVVPVRQQLKQGLLKRLVVPVRQQREKIGVIRRKFDLIFQLVRGSGNDCQNDFLAGRFVLPLVKQLVEFFQPFPVEFGFPGGQVENSQPDAAVQIALGLLEQRKVGIAAFSRIDGRFDRFLLPLGDFA